MEPTTSQATHNIEYRDYTY